MARIEVHPDRVVISLSRAEKLLAMHRKDVVIDRATVRSALITDDPWIWVRGVPSPGTHLAGKIACGVWRGLGGEDFLLVRGKNKAVVIDLQVAATGGGNAKLEDSTDNAEDEFSHYGRVIISTAHASELIRALKLDELTEPRVHSTGAVKPIKASKKR
jgi:hypothetical protein